MAAMSELQDLSQLSHEQKDALIVALFAQVQALAAKVTALEGRLALNSKNSSKPPSSDGLHKPQPKSLRKKGERPSGGQKGHPGQTLKQVEAPDIVITHAPPAQCDACQQTLGAATVVETRQVFDLPPLRFEVTEHQVLQAHCRCGKTCRGEFPAAITAPVQYGPVALAAVVHLTHQHMLPIARTAALMGDLFGLGMSEATVLAAHEQARERLEPSVAAIGHALQATAVVHADETGMRAQGKLRWMHVLTSKTLTWMACHEKRGRAAFEALGILPVFKGTLVHDGWRPYRGPDCLHALCNAHHLRELTYIFEQLNEPWAGQMIELLASACAEVAATGELLPGARINALRTRYSDLLSEGDRLNPRASPTGKRGRTKQSKAANLIDRLRHYADDVWRFATDRDVPFTNNLAEQAIRMPKVKQKISGGFRTNNGADTFCVIRSYLATLHKQGANVFHALILTFKGTPLQPCLG